MPRCFLVMYIFVLTVSSGVLSFGQTEQTPPAGDFPSRWTFHSSMGALKGEREWILRDGTKLKGIAILNVADNVEVQRPSSPGPGPSAATVPLAEFTDEDQSTIRAGLPSVPPEYRQYSMYQGVNVTPEWEGVKPKFPDRFNKVVDIVGDEVFFSSHTSLIGVKKSAFTAASLESITSQLRKVGRQIVLYGNRSPILVVGQPIHQTDDAFVMEVTTAYERSAGYVPGSRYILTKVSIGAVVDSQIRQVYDLVRKDLTAKELTEEELRQLPRLCKTTSGECFVSNNDVNGASIPAINADGMKLRVQPNQLSCADQWWLEMQRLKKGDAPVTAEMENQVLARLVDTSGDRIFWTLKNQMGHFRAKLAGTVANAFVFNDSEVNYFFVPAEDLAELDQRVAIEASRNREPSWLAKAELGAVLATRVIPMERITAIATVGPPAVLDSAFVGEYPTATYAGTKGTQAFELRWYSSLHAVREAHKWLEENKSLLNEGDSKKAVHALATKYPLIVKGADTPVRLPPDRQVREWKLTKEGNQFRGILVGQHGNDLVYETEIKGDVKYFLVSLDILSDEAKGVVKQLLPRTETRDWTSHLTRADNWQFFRVWCDPSGKVSSRAEPLVVDSISESLMVFRGLDGRRSSEPLPSDPTRLKATLAFYEPALLNARKAREAAESSLSLWKFDDAEPTLRADLIGSSEDSFLVRDVNGIEFLVNKSCLTEKTRAAMVARLNNPDTEMQQVEGAAAWKLPRVWCTRTKLIGPATPQFLTFDDRLLVVQTPEGSTEILQMSDLTLRERLSFMTTWRLAHGGLNVRPELTQVDSIANVERLLNEPITENAIVRKLPELEASIKQQVVDAFDKWVHATWQSTPIKLPASSSLLAVNADASAGIVEINSVWNVVDFETGNTQPVLEAKQAGEPNMQVLGPWMGGDKLSTFWVESGILYSGKPGNTAGLTILPNDTPKIVAACQTANFQSLVLYLQDGSSRRWNLADGKLEVIVEGNGARAPSPRSRIWASIDGNSVVIGDGTMSLLHVKPRDEDPALMGQLGSQQPALNVFVGENRALIGFEATPRQLTQLTAATTFLRPQTYGLPFQCSWLGFIDVNGLEAFQTIGRFEDAASMKLNRYIVHYRGPRDYFEQYPTQFINGQIDERARMAANGAALVHWQGDQAVVSRRPKELPLAPSLRLNEIVEVLSANRDVGQLEALSRFLEDKPYCEFGPYSGWLNLQFQETVKIACFNYQKHLGGDRLQRAMQLAEYFQTRFPESQVAGNVLAEIHRNLAWTARGGGFADSVTEAGQVAFRKHMSYALDLLQPMLAKEPSAATLHSAIDVAMGTGRLDIARDVSKQVIAGKHAENSKLHHAIGFLLLPRWHGKPGSSEAYRDSVDATLGGAVGNAMYAQLVADMLIVHGFAQPLSTQMEIDLQRVLDGTEAYYQTHTDATLIDSVILLMTIEAKNDWVTRLLKLKFDKQLTPSQTVASSPGTFRSIERQLGK